LLDACCAARLVSGGCPARSGLPHSCRFAKTGQPSNTPISGCGPQCASLFEFVHPPRRQDSCAHNILSFSPRIVQNSLCRLCSHMYIRVHLSLKFLSCIIRMQKDTANIPHVALAHFMLRRPLKSAGVVHRATLSSSQFATLAPAQRRLRRRVLRVARVVRRAGPEDPILLPKEAKSVASARARRGGLPPLLRTTVR
jgi:hypothetical protein